MNLFNFYHGYRDLMDNKADPRTTNWFLMGSPLPTLFICLFYAYFAKVLGPRLMENRKPFQLRKVLIVYNFIQVIFSTYLFYEACVSGWLVGYSFTCEKIDHSQNPLAVRMAKGCYLYYISKFTEFLDTIFFVMRKRYDQVSTLHVIHHGIMPMSVWWGLKFIPGGHATFFGFINTFVHIVMYTYYMLAAMGPHIQKYLWWKKYLTSLQIVQFVLVMFHSFQLLFKNECNYPIVFSYVIMGHAIMFYFLFTHFYKVTYIQNGKNKKHISESKARNDNFTTTNDSNSSIKNQEIYQTSQFDTIGNDSTARKRFYETQTIPSSSS